MNRPDPRAAAISLLLLLLLVLAAVLLLRVWAAAPIQDDPPETTPAPPRAPLPGEALRWMDRAPRPVPAPVPPQTPAPDHSEESEGAVAADPPEADLRPEPEPGSDPGQEPEAEPERRYLGTYQVYGYDTCAACCGKTDGITASGTVATVGRTAASNDFPLGTHVYIEGIGERVIEDRGGMAPGVIDVLCADHPACYAITGRYAVYLDPQGD